MRLLSAVLLALGVACPAFSQTYTISTFAGGGLPVNGPAASASIGYVSGLAVDSAGNVFMASGLNSVLRLDVMTGLLTVVAGNGMQGFSGDNGPATRAQLNSPSGVAVDAAGNLYIVDGGNQRIRKVSNGVITTVAGNGTYGFSGDNGPATSARLWNPTSVAVDSTGNLYIADSTNYRIRKVSNGVITTVAGNGSLGFSGDNGPATSAQLSKNQDVAVDSAGNLYIADTGNNCIRKVSNGVITTVAGNGATSTEITGPQFVAVDLAGNIYFSEATEQFFSCCGVGFGGGLYYVTHNAVLKVSNGVITTVAGNDASQGFGGDYGPATSALLNAPTGVAVDSVGNLYIADSANYRIRKISNGEITTVAGNGTPSFGGDSGPATSAQLYGPTGVAADSAGNLYIADHDNQRIRKVSNGVITTVAGNGTFGFSGDNGPATSAQLNYPAGAAVDSAGNLYIADAFNGRIRKVSNGLITTVAGNGMLGFGGDNGPATSAQLNYPSGIDVDSAGNLYIADTGNQRIRKVSNGVITTVAGNGTFGFSGDNFLATSAQLNGPYGVAVDSAGNFYIADTNNQRIRKVSNGVITTVAGNESQGFGADNGPASSAYLNNPYGVAVDSAGNLYIADTNNQLIRKVLNGVITTVAGNGVQAFGGDYGPATNAPLNVPTGVAVDSTGKVYIADAENNRIRVLTPTGLATFPLITAVTNAASNLPGPIAPGEMVVLPGVGLGPSQIALAHVGSDALYDAQLGETSVQFNGIPAAMIYTWAAQVAAVVPYGVTGTSAQVSVTYLGQVSAPVTVAVAASAPGLFTLDSTGKGQAAAVNENHSINTAFTPAPIGSVISLFATGEGQTSPAGVDGKPATTPFPKPNLPVSVTIGGQTISGPQLQYAGGAPGEIAGVMQINVRIPSGITPGSAVPIVIQVGNATSQTGVTIAVAGN